MVSVNFAAAAAALGIGASVSAGIVTVSQTFYNASFAARTFEYVQLMPTAGSSSGTTTRRTCSTACAAASVGTGRPWVT